MDDQDRIVDNYIQALSEKMDSSKKFVLFRGNDPDFNKELVIKEAKILAYKNLKTTGVPYIKPIQLLDIFKYIKKSNEIAKLLESNHAYITHIKEDGTLQYVFTNYGYRVLRNQNLID